MGDKTAAMQQLPSVLHFLTKARCQMTAHCYPRKFPILKKNKSARLTNLSSQLRERDIPDIVLLSLHIRRRAKEYHTHGARYGRQGDNEKAAPDSTVSKLSKRLPHFIFTIHLQPTTPSLLVHDVPTLLPRRPLGFLSE